MRYRPNGGVLGATITIGIGSARGVHSIGQIFRSRASDAWPRAGTIEAEVLMIAGGGAGGVTIGGGGGAGGVLVGILYIPPTPTTYPVGIGAGGASGADGTNGSNTTFYGLTCYGGGGAYTYTTTNNTNLGKDGGSGGGGAGNRGGLSAGGAATQTSQGGLTGYGYAGGTGKASGDPIQPAGGGGAGAVGQDGQNTGTTKGGDGGDGIYNSFRTGSNVGYAGGGSGYSYNSAANPTDKRNTFGGGVSIANEKVSGVANSGGGGAGGGFVYGPIQGAGGSGIVVIRYAGSARATGGTITTINVGGTNYTVHTFTGNDNFVVAG